MKFSMTTISHLTSNHVPEQPLLCHFRKIGTVISFEDIFTFLKFQNILTSMRFIVLFNRKRNKKSATEFIFPTGLKRQKFFSGVDFTVCINSA